MAEQRRAQEIRDSESGARERLMSAAERLWAEEGLGAVSLNRIRKEAGERNASAINYHFGSERDLLLAVLRRHWHRIARQRRELLALVDVKGDRRIALRGLVEAMVIPFAATLSSPEQPSCYVQLLAQWYRSAAWRNQQAMKSWGDNAVPEARRMAVAILDDLPPWIVEQRMRFAISLGTNALADWERVERRPERPASHLPREVMVALLIDSHVGLLAGECTDWLAQWR